MLALKRKTPVQPRAAQTVETLLDAAAQVLHAEGEARFTTNRVAEAAGFSIGTLYQYFPNKNAIVEALAQRECDRVEALIEQAVARADPHDAEAIIRIGVHAMINVFSGRSRVRKFVVLQMIRLRLGDVGVKATERIGLVFVRAVVERGGNRVRPLSESAAFVLTRAIAGTIRAAVLEDRSLLHDAAFEAELVRMALRFVLP